VNESLTLQAIIQNEMSIGYFTQSRKWHAATMRGYACGGQHAMYCYASTLEQAVEDCIREADKFECTEDHGEDDDAGTAD
jgi:hypothetical protein